MAVRNKRRFFGMSLSYDIRKVPDLMERAVEGGLVIRTLLPFQDLTEDQREWMEKQFASTKVGARTQKLWPKAIPWLMDGQEGFPHMGERTTILSKGIRTAYLTKRVNPYDLIFQGMEGREIAELHPEGLCTYELGPLPEVAAEPEDLDPESEDLDDLGMVLRHVEDSLRRLRLEVRYDQPTDFQRGGLRALESLQESLAGGSFREVPEPEWVSFPSRQGEWQVQEAWVIEDRSMDVAFCRALGLDPGDFPEEDQPWRQPSSRMVIENGGKLYFPSGEEVSTEQGDKWRYVRPCSTPYGFMPKSERPPPPPPLAPGPNEEAPSEAEPYLSPYRALLFDSSSGKPVAWGYKLVRHVPDELYERMRRSGRIACLTPGRFPHAEWGYVTRRA